MLGWTASAFLALVGGSREVRADENRVGVMFDAGFPDGGNASIIVRPFGGLRLSAGGGSNLISPGVRGGATYVLPGGFAVTVEAGHYFSGDATMLARAVSGNQMLDSPALRDVSYDYVNLHGGLEFGPKQAKFYLAGGSSYVSGAIRNAGESVTQAVGSSSTSVSFAQDPRVKGWVISAKLGFLVYFY